MSYVRIWVHTVFVTKKREPIITKGLKAKTIMHIKENAKKKDIYLDTINGVEDHMHCLISLGAEQNISKILQLIKGEVSHWINKEKLTRQKFSWADEYFAVSVSESQIEVVRKYINNQEAHHRKKSFSEECDEFIKKYNFKYLG